MLLWKLHWKEADDACMLCMVWQWLVQNEITILIYIAF